LKIPVDIPQLMLFHTAKYLIFLSFLILEESSGSQISAC